MSARPNAVRPCSRTRNPHDWLGAALTTDEHGFLVTGQDLTLTHLDPARDGRDRPPLPLETSRPGVFAAGDVRSGSIKRVASAVGRARWPCA